MKSWQYMLKENKWEKSSAWMKKRVSLAALDEKIYKRGSILERERHKLLLPVQQWEVRSPAA